MERADLFEQLWQQYCQDTPMVQQIYQLFLKHEGKVVNDHIAFRTVDDPRVNIEVLAKPFIAMGYFANGQYDFPVKKLFAQHFEHKDPLMPKVFISQLLTTQFSPYLQAQLQHCIDSIPATLLAAPEQLLLSGASWQPLSHQVYLNLLCESEYAAWLYAFGFRANHFTVSVNHLRKFPTIAKVNDLLKAQGIALNAVGGEIKGTPNDLLEQSSTEAFAVDVPFKEGVFPIPLAYYEFALRYPQKNGELYSGFVAASADKIFQSTDIGKHKAK